MTQIANFFSTASHVAYLCVCGLCIPLYTANNVMPDLWVIAVQSMWWWIHDNLIALDWIQVWGMANQVTEGVVVHLPDFAASGVGSV